MENLVKNVNMKILITGNLGYVGSVLTPYLRKKYPENHIIGYDSGYFGSCLLNKIDYPDKNINIQFYGDVRNLPLNIFDNVDAVIHLAAISNDPMGKEFESITDQINHIQSIEIAKKAKKAGVKNFVFASSCSVYGFASESSKTEKDEVNPLTAYAKSKIDTENELMGLANENFIITCLRFATACGYSPRLRLDLVLNDFVASAISNKKINILSDGSPCRPLIDVNDMARAIDWASSRKEENGGNFLIINTGANKANYIVKEIASLVSNFVPDTEIEINLNAAPDKRSYKVDFSLFEKLAPEFQPLKTLNDSILDLITGLKAVNFTDTNFRSSELIRLNVLKKLKVSGIINNDLFYIK